MKKKNATKIVAGAFMFAAAVTFARFIGRLKKSIDGLGNILAEEMGREN